MHHIFFKTLVIRFEILRRQSVKLKVNKPRQIVRFLSHFGCCFCFLLFFIAKQICILTSWKNDANYFMLSPSWLFICLLEAPDGIYAVFWLGLVTGASEINWEGSCTLSKKEKLNLKKKSLIYLSQFQNNVLNATESRSLRYFRSLLRKNLPGFTVSRQTA